MKQDILNKGFAIVILITSLFVFRAHSQKPEKAGENKKIVLSMELLKCRSNPNAPISGYDSPPDIKITIKNNTDTLASFYEDWNAWGHDAVRLQLTINDTVITLHHSGGCWDKNFPSSVMLFPGDSIIFYYDIITCTQQTCRCFYAIPKGVGLPKENLSGVSIRAIYQVNLENHQEEVNRRLNTEGFFRVPIMYSNSHPKRFKKLTFEQKIRSFVQNELISEPVIICFDKW